MVRRPDFTIKRGVCSSLMKTLWKGLRAAALYIVSSSAGAKSRISAACAKISWDHAMQRVRSSPPQMRYNGPHTPYQSYPL